VTAVGLITIGATVVRTWNQDLSDLRAELRRELSEQITIVNQASAKLAAENARLARYLESNQESALDQFYWVCHERKGILDRNQKSCTYSDLQIVQRFSSLSAQGTPPGAP
jgi:hypothetical protein